ncbi:MAG TPA: ABC transporter ATP-binding protein [Rhodospirillales bacterium]|nr:ABC transporter ATP-binding protein [Rhodospirillales bacterium]
MELTVTGVDVGYGRRRIVRSATFGLEPGTVTVLVGPNGAGKSTLLRAIAGLLPYRGSVRLGGEELARMAFGERARRVAYMPQDHGSDTVLTVFEVVLLGIHRELGWRIPRAHAEAVLRVLRRMGIEALADRGFATLSGGQRQLTMFAQMLLRSSAVLLLDEPTSALDLRHQLEILEHLRRVVREEGRIALVAMHDLSLAARFADSLLLLDEGRIRTHGPPLEVLTPARLARVYGVEVAILRGEGNAIGIVPLRRYAAAIDR